MQKLVGSILILAASTGIGVAKGMELQKHLRELESLKQLFLMLQSEITYAKSPFGEAFFHISGRMRGAFSKWLKELSAQLEEKSGKTYDMLWNESITLHFQKSLLTKEELEALREVGASMGYLDEEMQIGMIHLYLEQLEHSILKMRQEMSAKKKLCNCLGIMGGVFLVIVLL